MATKQYKLIHLGTGEQVFGIHSKAWFVERLRTSYIILDQNSANEIYNLRWFRVGEQNLKNFSDCIICQECEFDLVEVDIENGNKTI